jgi:hypothetical protein
MYALELMERVIKDVMPQYMTFLLRVQNFCYPIGFISFIILFVLMIYGFTKIQWWEVISLYIILFFISGAISTFVLPRPSPDSLDKFLIVRALYCLLFCVAGIIATILLFLK